MTDTITIVRHLRTQIEPKMTPDSLLFGGISNMGGITFVFEMMHGADQKTPTAVRYAYAQCRLDENFSKVEGTKIATDKMAKNDSVVIDYYDPNESLVFNVWLDLHSKAAKKDPVFTEKKLYRLRVAMKKIADQNEQISDIYDVLNCGQLTDGDL